MDILLFGSMGSLIGEQPPSSGSRLASESIPDRVRHDPGSRFRNGPGEPDADVKLSPYGGLRHSPSCEGASDSELLTINDDLSRGASTVSQTVLRPGVVRIIQEARAARLRVGIITTTGRSSIDSVIAAADGGVGFENIDVIVERGWLRGEAKSQAEAYERALASQDARAEDCVIIEDTACGADAARQAGIACVVTPSASNYGKSFSSALSVVSCLGDIDCSARQLAGAPIVSRGLVTLKMLANACQRHYDGRSGNGELELAKDA